MLAELEEQLDALTEPPPYGAGGGCAADARASRVRLAEQLLACPAVGTRAAARGAPGALAQPVLERVANTMTTDPTTL